MSSLGDIIESMSAKMRAITPAIMPGIPFRDVLTDSDLANSVNDTRYERAFRIVDPSGGAPSATKDYGGTSRECENTVLVQVGHVGAKDDKELRARIISDWKQIWDALQTGGLTWPSTLVNITAGKSSIARSGEHGYFMQQPWSIVYDET
jgi:hypothetical protein